MSNLSLLKHSFFNNSSKKTDDFSFKQDDFNLTQIKMEFSTVYQLFIAMKSGLNSNSEIVLYLNQLCDLLIQYYQNDYVLEDLNNFLDKKEEIEKFIRHEISVDEQATAAEFSSFLTDHLRSNVLEFAYSFKSASKLRRFLSSIISNRSYWNYSRTLANHIVIYLLDSQFINLIKDINDQIGVFCTPELFLEMIEAPQIVLRELSYSLYMLRFLINLILMMKHVIHAARSCELSALKVLLQELDKRFYIMANDLAWGIVNFLNNYYKMLEISVMDIARTNLAFLVFDAMLFLARWLVDFRQYYQCLSELKNQKNNDISALELALIDRQIEQLDDEWSAQCAYYLFNISAAILLASAYGVSLVCTGGLAFICLAALSMLGNASYNSCNEYKQYKQATIAIKREQANGLVLADEYHYDLLYVLNTERNEAYQKFWKTLLFNATFTTFVITAAAISWPLALVITLSYLSYKLWEAYDHNLHKNDKKSRAPEIYRLFPTKDKSHLPYTSPEPIHLLEVSLDFPSVTSVS